MPNFRSLPLPSSITPASRSHFRLFLAILLAFVLLSAGSLQSFAQGSKRKSLYDPIEERDRDRPDKRSDWMMRGRTAPKGQSAAALRLRAHQQKMTMRAARAAAIKAGTVTPGIITPWVPLGPAPLVSDQDYYLSVTGRSTAIAIDPSDATGNTVYIAGASGGVWKSTNAAATVAANVTWTPVTDQQASLTAGAVSVKSDGSVVLVGTGEPDNAIDSYYGVGILRSTDKGSTWTLIPSSDSGAHSFAGIGFTKFAWLPSSNTVVAAAADAFKGDQEALLASNAALGMYRSADGGQTWTYEQPTDGILPYFSATDVTYNATAGKFFASIQYHGVYSSTNGTTWTRLTTQPDPTNLSLANCPTTTNFNNITCPLYRGQLTTVPGRNEMYFWYVDGSDDDYGIWQSTNGGTSWKKIDETGITSCGDTNGGCGTDQAFYNLEISAVADGTATDIYAGAVNLFKCKLASGATTCSTLDPNLPNSWLNLTHVYGCSTIANVHPDEHGLDFMVVGGKDIMYFGNDGGVYRALNGFTGLDIGACNSPGTNQFDDLNATMGSMTQFVSFSVHPTDQNTVLGGTQDNGSPASSTATTSSQFLTVLGGDGGYNAINPTNPLEWLASLPDSEIVICEDGIGCNDNTFDYLASPDVLGNIDYGAFYTPFILDPQNSGEVLIGTCRVWRGDTATGTFTSLSPDFDTDGITDYCQGNEINQVHGLAAGGPLDANGFSNVVYAVTFGYGPLYSVPVLGGNVWATTNAATTEMTNVTGSINPNGYALSSVTIDKSDATGNTAYVGVMGFGTPHVWKTTNAGTSWTDWSGSASTVLPDAPVNDLLVDTQTAQIYAATDVGVFVSSTTTASWAEVGTASAPGATGYLPNVPTSALRMFNSGSVKKLRVSTYGRGIWEYSLPAVPDFTNAISNSPQTVFPTQTATFNGTLTSIDGYNSSVHLSCTGTTPSTCTLNPTQQTPTAGGATYTLTAGGAAGDYSFNAHAVGTDSNTTTHDAPVVLHVVDFALTSPSPNTLTVIPGGTSSQSTFVVSALGSFAGMVTLTCPTGLPTGTACVFSPSATVSPTLSTPVTVTLTVTASSSTALGSSTVTLSATTAGAPAAKTKTFTLQVNSPPPDFTLAVTATPATTVAGTNVTWSGTLTAVNGYNHNVTLSCTAGSTPVPGTCSFSPNPVLPTSGGAAFTVTVGSSTDGTYSFNIQGVGTDSTTHSQAVSLTVNGTFTVPPTLTNPTSANPGQATTTTMQLTPSGGSTFTTSVSYSCSGLPTGATCTFNPASPLASGSSATNVMLTVNTAGPFSGTAGSNVRGQTTIKRKAQNQNPRLWLPLTLPLAGVVFVGLAGRKISRRYKIVGLCLTLALALIMVACGGGSGSSGPPPVTISPTSAQVQLGGTQQFTASTTVTWSSTGSGSVNASGLYTAPTTGTTPLSATVTATPTSGTATSASVTIPAVSVSVTPGTQSTLFPSNLGAGEPVQQQQFTATVTNDSSNTAVNWAISAGGTTDTITNAGLYTAPNSVPSGPVTITATSQADGSKVGNATVNIQTPTPAGTYPITVTVIEGTVTKTTTFNLVVAN